MTVYSFHIFDRKGKTLFTKRYDNGHAQAGDAESESEQRKLVFGMLFSLREIVGTLAPLNDGFSEPTVLHSVRTGSCTLHVYETMSGMRLVLYTDNFTIVGNEKSMSAETRESLRYIYSNIWVDFVVRSPLYRPGDLLAVGETPTKATTENESNKFDIRSTEFEKRLDSYLTKKVWFT